MELLPNEIKALDFVRHLTVEEAHRRTAELYEYMKERLVDQMQSGDYSNKALIDFMTAQEKKEVHKLRLGLSLLERDTHEAARLRINDRLTKRLSQGARKEVLDT